MDISIYFGTIEPLGELNYGAYHIRYRYKGYGCSIYPTIKLDLGKSDPTSNWLMSPLPYPLASWGEPSSALWLFNITMKMAHLQAYYSL